MTKLIRGQEYNVNDHQQTTIPSEKLIIYELRL